MGHVLRVKFERVPKKALEGYIEDQLEGPEEDG